MSMKVNKIVALQVMMSIVLMLGTASCSKKSSSSRASRATGWDVDSQNGTVARNAGKNNRLDLVWFLLKEVHLLWVKYRMMLCTIGITPQLNNTFSRFTWMKLKLPMVCI